MKLGEILYILSVLRNIVNTHPELMSYEVKVAVQYLKNAKKRLEMNTEINLKD